MKRKLLCMLLGSALAFGLTVPTFAAGGMDAFQQAVYGQETETASYADVHEGQWFARPVALCSRLGFMNGRDGVFAPKGKLTVAEALTIAARVHQIYRQGSCSLENGSPWYQPYVDYCLSQGICDRDMFLNWTDLITRNQMACVFSRVLPAIELGVMNEDLWSYLDMASPALYQEEILTLYRAGVLTGSDAFGSFHPLDPISRSEAAAIITRVALPEERVMVNLLVPVIIAHQNAVVLALPQGFDPIPKGENETIYSNAGLGINCRVTITPWEEGDISDYVTQQELEDDLVRRLELNGGRLSFQPHTESFDYGGTEVCHTACDIEQNDGVSIYPMSVQLVTFIQDGSLYELEYHSIDSAYSGLYCSMLDYLYINGCTLASIMSQG